MERVISDVPLYSTNDRRLDFTVGVRIDGLTHVGLFEVRITGVISRSITISSVKVWALTAQVQKRAENKYIAGFFIMGWLN